MFSLSVLLVGFVVTTPIPPPPPHTTDPLYPLDHATHLPSRPQIHYPGRSLLRLALPPPTPGTCVIIVHHNTTVALSSQRAGLRWRKVISRSLLPTSLYRLGAGGSVLWQDCREGWEGEVKSRGVGGEVGSLLVFTSKFQFRGGR